MEPLANGRLVPNSTSEYTPPLAAQCQLKAHSVRAMEVERLHGEVICLTEEHGYSTAVNARRFGGHNPVST